ALTWELAMKCEDCQIIIEDYVDGLLIEREAESVGSHLKECASCARFHNMFIREQAVYGRYQRDIDVTPELWEAVEARINGEKIADVGLLARLWQGFAETFHAPRLSPALAAALIVIAIGVTVGVMSYLSSRKQSVIEAIKPPDVVAPGKSGDQPRSPEVLPSNPKSQALQ